MNMNEQTVRLDPTTANSGESDCNQWFSGFASHFFSEAGRTPAYEIDWSGYTRDGREAAIELKTRKYSSDKITAPYIECSKLLKLIMAGYYEGKVPFYINHWEDNRISVHRLLPTDPRPSTEMKRLQAKNPGVKDSNGKAKITESLKCELNMDDAWLFDGTTYQKVRGPIRRQN